MSAVTVETKGAISIIRINRPERMNAINQDVAVELQRAFKAFDADDDQRVAVLSSVGERAFKKLGTIAELILKRIQFQYVNHGLVNENRMCTKFGSGASPFHWERGERYGIRETKP